MKQILTIGCKIPGGYGTHVASTSKRSLLDADIILLSADNFIDSIRYEEFAGEYRGTPMLSEQDSRNFRDAVNHWSRELDDALAARKTVLVILGQVSVASRRLSPTRIVMSSNYDILPVKMFFVESQGQAMVLSQGENPIREYWYDYADQSQYRVYFEDESDLRPLITTKSGNRLVGAVSQQSDSGALIFLPWIDLGKKEFFEVKGDRQDLEGPSVSWTDEAKQWGSKFVQTITSIHETVTRDEGNENSPEWASDVKFMTLEEKGIRERLNNLEDRIGEMKTLRDELKSDLSDAECLKPLLYGQGRSLEEAILYAVRILGFEATGFREGNSEFDAVLECDEGRMIGEAEGKDKRPIHVDKLRQLATNVIEDFEREEITEQAIGVLFGNAYRLTEPSLRGAEQFTSKCRQLAGTINAVLMRTSDLFEVAKILIDNPDDEFAADCRKAIFAARGKEVQFPERRKS